MTSSVANIGGAICCTFKMCSAKMSCAWIGRGRWHVKCNFSFCLPYCYSVMPSKCPAHAYYYERFSCNAHAFFFQISECRESRLLLALRDFRGISFSDCDFHEIHTRLRCDAFFGHWHLHSAMDTCTALSDWCCVWLRDVHIQWCDAVGRSEYIQVVHTNTVIESRSIFTTN